MNRFGHKQVYNLIWHKIAGDRVCDVTPGICY